VSALDEILEHMERLARGIFPGPHGGVLLVEQEDGTWTLPATADSPGACSIHPEYAITCTATDPRAVEAIKEFLAEHGNVISTLGEDQMEDRSQFTAAQAKADRVFRAYGDSAPAALNGESLSDYRCRLARTFQSHSKQFKSADLSKLGDAHVLTAIEDAIYADASAALHDPATFKAGELRPIITRDPSGREITKYIGHDGACWDQFNPPIRHVRRINTPNSGLH
jgi:hypothetical protein